MTATPIPYKHTNFIGLLSFVHSVVNNNEAQHRIKNLVDGKPFPNPYKTNSDRLLTYPNLQHFIYTASAFKAFCSINKSFTKVSPRLARIYKRFIIRRDFIAKYVINPQGKTH